MAEKDDVAEAEAPDAESGAEGEGEGGSKTSKKLIILIGVVLLLGLGGAGAAYFTGLMQPLIDLVIGTDTPKKPDEPKASKDAKDVVFYELPELLVNLSAAGGRRPSFLKMRVSLELEKADDIKKIEGVMPRIMDNFQVYLRELRVEDLKGSAGIYRLREELLTRVSAAAAPAKVRDVLFKEMLIQ